MTQSSPSETREDKKMEVNNLGRIVFAEPVMIELTNGRKIAQLLSKDGRPYLWGNGNTETEALVSLGMTIRQAVSDYRTGIAEAYPNKDYVEKLRELSKSVTIK